MFNSEELSEEMAVEVSFAKGSQKLRQQEAENIRQEYVKRTGPLPLPRTNKSSDGEELNQPRE